MRRLAGLIAVVLSGCAARQSGSLPGQDIRGHTTIESESGRSDVTTTHTPSIESKTIAVSLDRVWGALPAAYSHFGLPIHAIDPNTHLIGTGPVMVHRSLAGTSLSEYLDCGSDVTGLPKASFYSVQLDVRTQLDTAPDSSTLVRTVVEATARDGSTSNSSVQCSTKGALEHRMVELLSHIPK